MAANKTIKAMVRLLVPAGQAKPAPPVGPALGSQGLNIMSFCKDFNAKTSEFKPGVMIPVKLTAYEDKTYVAKLLFIPLYMLLNACIHDVPGLNGYVETRYPVPCAGTVNIVLVLQSRRDALHHYYVSTSVEMRTPPATYFIKQAAGVESGSKSPGHEVAGSITLKQLYEVALIKQQDLEWVPVEKVFRSLMGTVKSMGLQLVRDPEGDEELPAPVVKATAEADAGAAGKKGKKAK